MAAPSPSLLRRILWPTLITLAVTGARLYGEVEGTITRQSGGAGFWLGITWLVLLFGGWFGFSLTRQGRGPNLRPTPLWTLMALLPSIAVFVWKFVPLRDQPDAEWPVLQEAVMWVAGAATAGMLLTFVIWPALATTLCLYGLIARGTVLGVTWLAKHQGWETHYTKFGPQGRELDMAGTVSAASLAQFGFWVPFTVIVGTLAGSLFAKRK